MRTLCRTIFGTVAMFLFIAINSATSSAGPGALLAATLVLGWFDCRLGPEEMPDA